MAAPRFLTMAEVLLILEDQIRRYGGQYGLRDPALLSSALAVPGASWSGAYLHEDIPEMAAAYAYHISGNHPFIDGNKRVALAAALVFLDINGYDLICPEKKIYEIMMAVASGAMGEAELVKRFRKYSSLRRG